MHLMKSMCVRRVNCQSFSLPTTCSRLRRCSQRARVSESEHTVASEGKTLLSDIHALPTHPCFRDQVLLSSSRLMLQHVKTNIIHEDEAIIAVNKLPGTPVYQRPGNTECKYGRREQKSGKNEDTSANVSIQELLPELRQDLGCPDLCIALPAQREHSGIVLLGKTKESREKIKQCQQHARAQKLPLFTSLVISSAVTPPSPHSSKTVIFRQKQIGDQLLPVIMERKSRSAQEQGEQLVVQMERRSVVWNPLTKALLSSVTVSQDQEGWGCLETYMADLLCPVLGDATYSRSACTILGLPVRVEPTLVQEPQQVLSGEMLRALKMKRSNLSCLPVFLHRYKVHLHLPKHPPFIITASPLPSFSVAQRRLGLQTLEDA